MIPGSRFGRYEVLSALGAGGMGTVYKARDTVLDRTVAIKVISAAAQPGGTPRTLVDEARTLARLSHPNIVAVYDAGETAGQYYLVTELVEGRSLAEMMKRPLQLDQDHLLEI